MGRQFNGRQTRAAFELQQLDPRTAKSSASTDRYDDPSNCSVSTGAFIAVLVESPLDVPAHFGTDAFPPRPINRNIATQCGDELAGDDHKCVIAHYIGRRVIGRQRGVKGQFLL